MKFLSSRVPTSVTTPIFSFAAAAERPTGRPSGPRWGDRRGHRWGDRRGHRWGDGRRRARPAAARGDDQRERGHQAEPGRADAHSSSCPCAGPSFGPGAPALAGPGLSSRAPGHRCPARAGRAPHGRMTAPRIGRPGWIARGVFGTSCRACWRGRAGSLVPWPDAGGHGSARRARALSARRAGARGAARRRSPGGGRPRGARYPRSRGPARPDPRMRAREGHGRW